MLNQDTLREATRLTQAGQLTEATVLLQRMFRGKRAPAAASPAPGLIRFPGRAPPTIDFKANGVGNADSAAPAERPAATARRHRPLFDRAKDGSWLGLRGAKHAPASMTDIVPEGAKFIDGIYSNKAGSRTYKLFVPSGYHRDQPLPLVVMLHGCTQSPDDFAAGTRMNFIAEEQNCLVVYPAQRSDANPSKCWNWFRAADQRRDEGEPSLIAGITRAGYAGLFGRSQARLRCRSFSRRRCCGNHGGHLQRPVRGGRDPFRPRLRSRHRYALGIRRHATRGQSRSSNCGGWSNGPDHYLSRRPRRHRASRQRLPSCRTCYRSDKDAEEGASRADSRRAWVYPHTTGFARCSRTGCRRAPTDRSRASGRNTSATRYLRSRP